MKSTRLTGVYVFNTCLQILISVQVNRNKRCVFAQYIAGFAGVNSVKLVFPARACEL